jgi:Zn-dependent M28 family amino/carboxypeptidase
MLLINSSDGQTDGAVDNAGSLSGLVEIAKRLSTSPHLASGLHVELVATAGEEAGCLGAMALASSVVKNSGLPIVLNLEALGAGPRLLLIAPARKGKRKENRASLAETITASASEERVAVTRWLLAPGFWTDHRPFLRAGCEAVTLCGFGRGISTIHTHLDRVERLDGEALAQQVEFVLAAVARLATV